MLIIEYLFLIFNYLLFIILLLRYLFVYLHIFILKIIATNVKLKILRKVLEEAINNIDAGNSNHSDDELDDIISSLTKLNRGIKRISKREAKLDGLLKAIEDKDGKVDIEGILSESIDNLVVAQVKKYPNVFSGVEIGGGTIKINIPSFDKQLVFDYNDIETFKQNILN